MKDLQSEVRALLDVAQLYETMDGQAQKAARYYFAAGKLLHESGSCTEAREHFQKVLLLHPGHEGAQILLANAPEEQTDSPAALTEPERPPEPIASRWGVTIRSTDIRSTDHPPFEDPPGQGGVPAKLPPKRPPGAGGHNIAPN